MLYWFYTKNSVYLIDGTRCLAVYHRETFELDSDHISTNRRFLYHDVVNPYTVENLVGERLFFVCGEKIFRSSAVEKVVPLDQWAIDEVPGVSMKIQKGAA